MHKARLARSKLMDERGAATRPYKRRRPSLLLVRMYYVSAVLDALAHAALLAACGELKEIKAHFIYANIPTVGRAAIALVSKESVAHRS